MKREKDEKGGLWPPDVRDFHVYGGLVLAAIGLEIVWRGAGLTLAGAYLVYIGCWRMGT